MLAGISLPAMAQYDIIDSVAYKDQTVDVGVNRTFTREQSSAAVSIISNKDVNHRGARNIGNSIIGQGNGLVSLQGGGLYTVANPTFYVRGLQSLNGSAPLVLVDGIERDIDNVHADDVETVTVLKDAAATAIYGYKGANGAILITTKHGSYNSKSIRFSYDHEFQAMGDKPAFVDAYTYGMAVNEAYRNQGGKPVYTDQALQAYRDGSNPYYYPNVDWANETFRDMAHMNRWNLEFRGGSRNFRYYTDLNLLSTNGFINHTKMEDVTYSTQDMYSRGTLRSNMDIDLGDLTKLHTHLYGVLTERSQPGSQADLWNMVYTVPSNAFPIQQDNGVWGGNATYTTQNPVAQSAGAAYFKNHQRALYADMQLEQDLSGFVPGLSATALIGYDTWSNVYEDHSKTYLYGYYAVAADGSAQLVTDGLDSNMGTGANNNGWDRRFTLSAALNYQRALADKHNLYSQLMWNYEFTDFGSGTGSSTGVNTSVYRGTASWFTNYNFDNRFTADLALVLASSNRLAKGSKWGFSPTLSASWNLHNESFMQDIDWVNFLKVRASAGMQQLDVLPGDNVWTYYNTFYAMASSVYPFYSYGTDLPNTYIPQAKTENLGREHALKYNFGVDATLFQGLNLSADYYYQHRYDAWVSTAGAYTSVFGYTAPYENLGVVDSYGIELSADYSKQLGDWTFNVGATFNLNKNEIKEQAEEPRLYSNLVRTGLPLNQVFGYKANGFFQQSDDVNGDGVISAAEMQQKGYPVQTFTTIYPGDVRYEDVTGDGVIDANDVTKIGYNNGCPELNYTFHFGAEYKGLGFDALFQGVGNYSGTLTTNGMYRSAVATNTLSQYLYDNCWSAERGNTENPKFARLSTTANANNDLVSTLNVFDRSYLKLRNLEVYYYLPSSLLDSVKFISRVKVYMRGTDLFTIDNLDEGDAGYYAVGQPLSRNLQLGASITF